MCIGSLLVGKFENVEGGAVEEDVGYDGFLVFSPGYRVVGCERKMAAFKEDILWTEGLDCGGEPFHAAEVLDFVGFKVSSFSEHEGGLWYVRGEDCGDR